MGIKDEWTTEDGSIRLLLGDCLEILPGLGKVDAVVTDPPYGIGYSSGHGSSEWGDGSILGDSDTFCRDESLRIAGGVSWVVFGSWKRQHPEGTRAKLIWDTLGALGMGDLAIPWKPSHQEIYIGGDRSGFCGERGSDVIRCAPVQSMAKNGRVHPFEKPVELLEELISHLRGKTILDPFMGSGTTGVACIRLGRRFVGIEKEPKYFEIAKKRIRDELDKTRLIEAPKRLVQRSLLGE